MSWRNRVVWSEGMFLQPQHLQQELRFLEHLVDARVNAAHPHAWGFVTFEIDEGLLALGKFGLSRAAGVFPDGTPFSMPHVDPLPAALDISSKPMPPVSPSRPCSRPAPNEVRSVNTLASHAQGGGWPQTRGPRQRAWAALGGAQ